jgi:hypothetical protein
MTPAADFRPAGPRFRLLFGETNPDQREHPSVGPSELFIPTPQITTAIFGWGVIYAMHAFRCIKRGRVWQAEHYVGAVRDHALSLACVRQGVAVGNARGYDELSRDTLSPLEASHIRTLEPRDLREALASSVSALMREGEGAGLPDVAVVSGRLDEVLLTMEDA